MIFLKGLGQNKNETVFKKVAEKCYLPTNQLLLKLIKRHKGFKMSFSFSGVFLDQAERYDKKVLKSFIKLVDTGNVELFNETYYHSLTWLFSNWNLHLK
jgi:alpha-amylase